MALPNSSRRAHQHPGTTEQMSSSGSTIDARVHSQGFGKCFNYMEVMPKFWEDFQEKHLGTLSAIEDGKGHSGDQLSYHNRIR
ncbi:hypothetical protein DVH24_031491 [Malus domestica]|uniref:Uncharacterized protein n=1 Tax=Malus domestica TaxID=3750 RepID=A0A498HCG9_MALDO|nr:hypothetical protein DVH24_031491 [Malus domestica]